MSEEEKQDHEGTEHEGKEEGDRELAEEDEVGVAARVERE